MEATVAERGQITLPKAVRDALGLTKGTLLKVELEGGRIILRKNVDDVLAGLWQGDTDQARITTKLDRPMVGANLAAHLDGLRAQMRKAAENLEFEEAARLRDEVKRLEAVELAVADDPLARQSAIDQAAEAALSASGRSTAGRAGQRGGTKRSKRRH